MKVKYFFEVDGALRDNWVKMVMLHRVRSFNGTKGSGELREIRQSLGRIIPSAWELDLVLMHMMTHC